MVVVIERLTRELAIWGITSWTTEATGSDPFLVYGSSTSRTALAWSGLGIPTGATILHAEIRLRAITSIASATTIRAQKGGPVPAIGDPLWATFTDASASERFGGSGSVADITAVISEWLTTSNGDDLVLRLRHGGNSSYGQDYYASPVELRIEYEVPPAEGSAHVGFSFGATGAGVAPYVPPRQGQAHVGFTFGVSARGERPPAEGAQGSAHAGFAFKVRAKGEATAQGSAAVVFAFGTPGIGARDSDGQAHARFTFDVQPMTVSPPVPPPPPWEELATDPRYQAALTARHATIDARVEIVDLDDTILATLGGPDATLPGVVSGSVSCNSSSQSWWTCSLVIDNSDLMPTAVGDLLHPLSHNRVRVWWRILLAPGTWAEVPMGTYFIQWPKVTDSGGAEVSLAVEGRDVTAEIARSQMQNSMELGGLTVTEAIEALLSEYAPWATSALEHSDHRLPDGYHAGEPGANPLTVVREIARTTGMIVHADRMGRVVSRRTPGPEGAPVAEFVEGPLCAITSAGVAVPMDRIANRVKVVSAAREDAEGEEIEPIWAVAQIDDETSPLWVGHGFYYDHYTESDSVTTVEQAETMAKRILSDKTTLVEDIELVIFPHPHLDPFDTVATTATRVGIDGYQEVRGFSLALGSAGGQRLTLSARREFS